MNRAVDSGGDLYALRRHPNYEMLTGTLPFTAADPMEWVHCHIARQPTPPGERANGIPGPLSAIVMKLLAKTAEDRYQTAAGSVAADLPAACLAEWGGARPHRPVPAHGTQDVPDRLLIPETLYGRGARSTRLLAAFDRVVANGTPELVLVSGYSGIGKSSVVHELHKVLVPPRGLFASGKFDQYKQDIPYATLAQAASGALSARCWSRSEAELRPVAEMPLGRGGRTERSDHRQPRSRAGTRDRNTVAGPGTAAPGCEEPLPDGFPTLPRRVFARPEHPLAAVPR